MGWLRGFAAGFGEEVFSGQPDAVEEGGQDGGGEGDAEQADFLQGGVEKHVFDRCQPWRGIGQHRAVIGGDGRELIK